jgi:Tol biopolymer transport system component
VHHFVPDDAAVRFKGQDVMVGRRQNLALLPGVSKDELSWSPDGERFAYAKPVPQKAAWRVYIKNVAGDPVNEFEVYRPGQPQDIEWLDDRRLAYVAPTEGKELQSVYVIHDAETGEVVAVRRGRMFAWSPGKKRLAYVAGKSGRETISVDGHPVWPRATVPIRIHGEVSWSPSGRGLAFVEAKKGGQGRLVVMLELDDPNGDLTWTLPAEALTRGLHVFWAGESKVLIGETNLKPKFAANWERLQ